jgi:adenine-specific DNA-methyltransferase
MAVNSPERTQARLHATKTTLSAEADQRRLKARADLVPATKSELGQFMTPAPVAEYMASMFGNVSQPEISLLDPGAGVGSLTAAFMQRLCAEPQRPQHVSVTAYEIDTALAATLRLTLEECARVAKAAGIQMTYRLLQQDFILHAAEALEGSLFAELASYTHVIANPPYKKIQSASVHRKALRRAGIEATNLYAAFIALAIRLLAPTGELVAITPRSFANGPYFLPFRKIVLSEASIQHIHIFETRDTAFREDEVLQENVVYQLVRSVQAPQVLITSSHGPEFQDSTVRQVDFADIIHPGDSDLIIHIPACDQDADIMQRLRRLPHTLQDLGVTVSTGPVIDFRLKAQIHKDLVPSSAPLIYPAHFHRGTVVWPKPDGKKPNAIDDSAITRKWLLPNGWYTLTRRFSAKEEKRRIVAAVFDPGTVTSGWVGFENHLNVFHCQGHGLSPVMARGLALYLNSTIVDRFFRLFNGHTQVNATDLRALPYPSEGVLITLGQRLSSSELPAQEVIDGLVEEIVFSLPQ